MSPVTRLQDMCHDGPTYSLHEAPLRIAIVGGGPRGLHCLIELNEQLREVQTGRPVSITLFEPCEFPGAGNVYHPGQPKYLRMNFAAKHINAWRPVDAATDRQRCSVSWLQQHVSESVCPEDFVPRADVGAYLHSCFQTVLVELRKQASVIVRSERITAIERTGRFQSVWQLETEDERFCFDQVVLTVGHEGWRQCESADGEQRPVMLPTFPVQRALNEKSIPAGSTVAVRGFGLTWIDAALALTEGRGGAFTNCATGHRYERCGHEPKRLLPYSRSGRPMLAKPDESVFPQPPELEEVWEQGRQTIDAIRRPIGEQQLVESVWDAVTTAAGTAANYYIDSPNQHWNSSAVDRWFRQLTREHMKPTTTFAFMRQSWLVATGQAAPEIAWAMGAAWRNLYPALVRCVSYGGLAAEAWPTFRKVSVEMERIAFGPPAENVGRILALIDAGIVDLSFLTGHMNIASNASPPQFRLTTGNEEITVDHFVDAVIPSPLQNCPVGPIRMLLRDGHIHRLHGIEGIRVDETGRPTNGDGQPIDGLAILGRATEGCVLGNDSLSRTLHDHPRRWAHRVVSQIESLEKRS